MGSGSPVGLVEYHFANRVGMEITLLSQTLLLIIA
jgi:hypothetical protein